MTSKGSRLRKFNSDYKFKHVQAVQSECGVILFSLIAQERLQRRKIYRKSCRKLSLQTVYMNNLQ